MNVPETAQGDLELTLQLYRGLPVGQLPKEMITWLRRAEAAVNGAQEESAVVVRDAIAAAAAVHASLLAARRLGAAALRQRAARAASQCAERSRRMPRGRS